MLRTTPPSVRKVCAQVAMVYLFATLATFWFAVDATWSPSHFVDAEKCQIRFDLEQDDKTAARTRLAFILSFWTIICVPSAYVVYVRCSMWRRNLLPISGQTRSFALYFMRILLLFFVFFIPNLILSVSMMKSSSFAHRFWLHVGSQILFPAQCLVTLYIGLTKQDIKKVVRRTTSNLMNIKYCSASDESEPEGKGISSSEREQASTYRNNSDSEITRTASNVGDTI